MDIYDIPKSDLKFVRTTDKKICPKCGCLDIVDTGHHANNIERPADTNVDIPEHPIYRCTKCAQLFRLNYPTEK